jgi:hypothetical protein
LLQEGKVKDKVPEVVARIAGIEDEYSRPGEAASSATTNSRVMKCRG